MSDVPFTSQPQEAPTHFVDVWSRTAPKYRRRAVLMLCLLALLFAGLCCFMFWLRTGAYAPWQYSGYADLMYRSFNPSGQEQVTLSQFLLFPISVDAVPIHSVIVGLLFASTCSIPILVSILYRLPFSILFAAMVIFLAAMPWLGLTVLFGCVLASLPRFRFSFRFASALLGLVPVGIYFVSASWEPAGSSGVPIQNKALMYAPWVLAILTSCVICALALAIARLIDYRPGGVPPVLAVVFAVPVVLFHTQVGRDELEFRILEHDLGRRSARMFAPIDISSEAHRLATNDWGSHSEVSYEAIYREKLKKVANRVVVKAEDDRAWAIVRCDEFLKHFPWSRYAAAVNFLKGQAQDARINQARFLGDLWLEFRVDLPSVTSRHTWRSIEEGYHDSSLAAVAAYKLAILEAQAGRLDEAMRLLEPLIQPAEPATSTRPAAGPQLRQSVFQKADPAAGLGVNLKLARLQANRLHEMISTCRPDPVAKYSEVFATPSGEIDQLIHPLQLMLRFDTTSPIYRENLVALIAAFPDSNAADYARIRIEMLERAISRRIIGLRQTVEDLRDRPAVAEARMRLAEVLQEDSLVTEARAVLTELTTLQPDSCWSLEAKERLASLSMMQRESQPETE
ncbi:hypothetical protein B7486_02615 [cyanobacterium TDX16]|nr:hypothetical protein B7486_02615 [cyanobacterium TDX16]